MLEANKRHLADVNGKDAETFFTDNVVLEDRIL